MPRRDSRIYSENCITGMYVVLLAMHENCNQDG